MNFTPMQTLEINFKAVFENTPGRNVLLLPNPPFFTVAAISDAYCKTLSVSRKKIIGKSITQLFSLINQLPKNASALLLESLEQAQIGKEDNHIIIETLSTSDQTNQKIIKIENTPVVSPDGEVMYIIHHLKFQKRNIGGRRNGTVKISGDAKETGGFSFIDVMMQAPVAIGILKGSDFIIEEANIQMLDLWGKTSSIIGQPIIEALPEITDQPFPQLLQNVYETGVEYHGYETRAILKKGDEFAECYFNFLYAPIKGDQGNIERILMIATDVTNLVKAKKGLEESEKKYKDLISNADVATAVYLGKDMEIRLANDAMLTLWGKDSSVIGKPLRDALPELTGQRFLDLLENVYETGLTYRSSEDKAELVVDGQLQTFYFNFTYKALYNTAGEIYGILNMAVDVSETVTAKNKINDAEERWRIALNSAELGTWDYYPATEEFICSARTRELFGLSASTPATVKKLMDAIEPNDQKRVRAEVTSALGKSSSGNFGIEYEVIGVDDHKQRWHRATGQVFFKNLKPSRITGTVLDITERKRVEEALEERVFMRTVELLEANKKLERSNLELEQYAYVASHDLQEPLRKILVYTDLLRNSPLLQSGVENIRLEKITASAIRMSHLIKDLLNFSRLLKTENVFSKVDLNQVIRNVVEDFELMIQETNAEIKVDSLPEIEAFGQQMNQLFYNLINNALKFRKDNQRPIIKITASLLTRKEVKSFKDLNRVLTYYDIQVCDNGIGFNTRYVKHIFEIFKRLHTRSRYEGTGIGLALCRKICRNHGGEIYADSKEGDGSVFHVLLPVKQYNSDAGQKL